MTTASQHAWTKAAWERPQQLSRVRTDRTDTVLLSHVATGNQAALAALYDRLAPTVHGLACRMLEEPAAAGNVTYEVFLEMWRSAPAFDPAQETVQAWALRLTGARIAERLAARTRPGPSRRDGRA